MLKIKNKNKILEYLLIVILMLVSIYTRFWHLDYSDYIGDEHKAFIELNGDQTVWEFFMSRRKGPIQFLVSHIPYLITGDFRNELAQRIPFSIISVAAVFVFYQLIKKVTKNIYTAFFAAFLFTVNGFIVGFGRIAQYQNLNLLFSLTAIYFYWDLIYEKSPKKLLKNSILGTLFWSLSILSHWDAIFIIPVVTIVFIRFYLRDDIDKKFKLKTTLLNFIAGCLLLLPFLIPYTKNQVTDTENAQYFRRRVEIGHLNKERYKELIELYNPFITFYLLVVFGAVGALHLKKSYIFTLWLIFGYTVFELFVRKPGTHIYNFIIPLFVLSSIALISIYKKLPKYLNYVWGLLVCVIMIFLFYQTHYIFIDHTDEYPWKQKVFYDFSKFEEKRYDRKKVKTRDRVYHQIITPEYSIDQKLPLFGFPHKRYWNEINDFINEQNHMRDEDLEYITNEVKTISEWYMDTGYGSDRPFFLVGIKRPLSFRNDYKYPQIGGKETIREIENEYGETVVRIYYVKER